jgi:hypothetical protein
LEIIWPPNPKGCMVENQIINLTPDIFLDHNLCILGLNE